MRSVGVGRPMSGGEEMEAVKGWMLDVIPREMVIEDFVTASTSFLGQLSVEDT